MAEARGNSLEFIKGDRELRLLWQLMSMILGRAGDGKIQLGKS